MKEKHQSKPNTHRDPIEITLMDDISSHFHTTSVDRIGKR